MVMIMQNTQEKLSWREMKVNTKKQERFMRMETNFIVKKNEGHMPSSLGGR